MRADQGYVCTFDTYMCMLARFSTTEQGVCEGTLTASKQHAQDLYGNIAALAHCSYFGEPNLKHAHPFPAQHVATQCVVLTGSTLF